MNYLRVSLLLILLTYSMTYADNYKEVSWDDLMPVGWLPNIPEDEGFFEGETYDGLKVELPNSEPAPIIKALDKQKIKLPGYIIPIKFTASSVSEFLLVPYVGACIHTPPPPENQIVYVSLKKPLETQDLWAPVWVSGTMNTQTSTTEFATSGYHLTEAITEVYEY